MTKHLWLCALLFCQFLTAAASHPHGGEGVTPLGGKTDRGWTETSNAKNLALLVGVAKNLPGIDKDVDNVKRMASHNDYKFTSTTMMNSASTVSNVVKNIKDIASKVDENGTFLFYFSGHGGRETILMQDRTMNISELRAALEASRKDVGPLKRLLLFFDSCYSGSLLPKVRGPFALSYFPALDLESEVDTIVEKLQPKNRNSAYYDKLFVFASSRENETSAAGSNGSAFTVAMGKAFDESMEKNNTIAEFIKKTYDYTVQHHPVARLVPEDLNNEKMRN